MAALARIYSKAHRDIVENATFLGQDDRLAADRFLDAVESTTRALLKQPYLGGLYPNANQALTELRAWRVKGFNKYIIFYQLNHGDLDVVRVLHASRDIEALLNEE